MMTFLRLRKMPRDAEREQDGGDDQIMSETDDHDPLLTTPCPRRDLRDFDGRSRGVRAFCSAIFWRLTRGLWCRVSTIAPIIGDQQDQAGRLEK